MLKKNKPGPAVRSAGSSPLLKMQNGIKAEKQHRAATVTQNH